MNLLRYIVIALNLVLYAVGLMVLKVGLVYQTPYFKAMLMFDLPYGLIGVSLGISILIVATIGIVGAITFHAILRYSYVGFAVVLIIMEITMFTCSIMIHKYHNQDRYLPGPKDRPHQRSAGLDFDLKKYYLVFDPAHKPNNFVIDSIVTRHNCCGIEYFLDFQMIPSLRDRGYPKNERENHLPRSCCGYDEDKWPSRDSFEQLSPYYCFNMPYETSCINFIINDLNADFYPTVVALILGVIIEMVIGILTLLLKED